MIKGGFLIFVFGLIVVKNGQALMIELVETEKNNKGSVRQRVSVTIGIEPA